MHNQNFKVIELALRWLNEGDRVWFATVIETWGASPRPPGSVFAYNQSKRLQEGSLSGGCIEENLIQQLSDDEPACPTLLMYGGNPEESARLNLPCGGQVKILVEPLNTSSHIESFRCVLNALKQNKRAKRVVSLNHSQVEVVVDVDVKEPAVRVFDDQIAHVLGPVFKALIVGAGDVAQHLIPILNSLDFQTALCDPREDFLAKHQTQQWDCDVYKVLPDDLVSAKYTDEYSAVITLAHDPRVDDMALMAALDSRAFYIGAMGSLNTTRKRIDRLKVLGYSDSKLQRLDAPIGLSIGSKTPPEIAISIASKLIQERNKYSESLVEDRSESSLCNLV